MGEIASLVYAVPVLMITCFNFQLNKMTVIIITILSLFYISESSSQNNIPPCHGRKIARCLGSGTGSSASLSTGNLAVVSSAPNSSPSTPPIRTVIAPGSPSSPIRTVIAPGSPSSPIRTVIAPPSSSPPTTGSVVLPYSPPSRPAISPPPLTLTAPAPTTSPFEKRNGNRRPLIIGLSVGIPLLMISVMIYCVAKKYSCCESWNSTEGINQHVEEFLRNYASITPKLYTYSEIKKFTDSFSNKLGHGGFGHVYKGKLPDGRDVAVKVLNDSTGNGEDFMNEVAAISKTSHMNVVALLGFCCSRNKRALIYEFMQNGSLDRFIGENQPSRLEWKLLYEIVVGIARGLEYLHQGCNTRIVHFDIKPQNILLDADFCPKISDFGLARLCKKKQSILSTKGPRGTAGYIAPEMVTPGFGGVSHKSDVYSYGMMVLEMVGLTRKLEMDSLQTSENYFPNWIYEHVELGKDLPLQSVVGEDEKESAMKIIYVGLWCIKANPSERPSINKVVEMLEGSLQSLPIPPKPILSAATITNFNQESYTTSSIS